MRANWVVGVNKSLLAVIVIASIVVFGQTYQPLVWPAAGDRWIPDVLRRVLLRWSPRQHRRHRELPPEPDPVMGLLREESHEESRFTEDHRHLAVRAGAQTSDLCRRLASAQTRSTAGVRSTAAWMFEARRLKQLRTKRQAQAYCC